MQRNYQLDFFRGLLIIVMVIDHLFTPENIIRSVAGEFFGWFSAAEGFVFISGVTAGLVYSYRYNKNGKNRISVDVLVRTLKIYKYHILSILFLMLVMNSNSFVRDYWLRDYEILYRSPTTYLIWFSVFLYQPVYFDILPMYIAFMLLVPVTVRCLENRSYLMVGGVSIGVYLLGYSNILAPFYNTFGNRLFEGYFNILCWQLLFFMGLIIGHFIYHKKIDIRKSSRWFYIALLIVVVLFIFKRVYVNFGGDFVLFVSNELADKSTLKPLRLINVAALIFMVAFLATRFKGWFTYKPVCKLGMYSLQVFAFHIILVVMLKPFDEYFNSLYKIKISHQTYFYPVSTIIFGSLIIPALFIVAALSKKKSVGQQRYS